MRYYACFIILLLPGEPGTATPLRVHSSHEPIRPRATREIFLILPRHHGPNREVARGIFEFAYPRHRWVMFFVEQTERAILSIRDKPNAAGVIGQFGRDELAAAACALSIPVVSVHGGISYPGLPQVGIDRYRQGEYVATWFLHNGFPHCGFYGLGGEPFSDAQQAGFEAVMQMAGRQSLSITPSARQKVQSGSVYPNPVHRWLLAAPKPFAVYCPNDILANELSAFCLQMQLAIPRDVLILGADNDELLCLGCLPALSSIRLPYRELGRRAAALLERMIEQATVQHAPELVHEPDIVERQSTVFQHVNDQSVERALQWMREHCAHGINVEDVARAAGVSLRSLEVRFLATVGRTPRKELSRLRLELVKRLLREQSLTLEQIADKCGFSSGIYLSQFFRREAGMTPGDYRRTFHR
jgi:LacI family transcriptional regulator